MSGFVMFSREDMDDYFSSAKEFSKFEAYAWLVKEAAISPYEKRVNGKVITIERGQVAHSSRFIAKAWGWTQCRVLREIKTIQERKKIDSRSDSGVMVITICNYDKFTIQKTDSDSGRDSKTIQQRFGNDSNYKKEKEKGKKEESISVENLPSDTPKTPSGFEEFWSLYPKKIGKQSAKKKYDLAIKRGVSHEKIILGVTSYAKCETVRNGFICNPEVWLNQGRWDDEHLPPLPQSSQKTPPLPKPARINLMDPETFKEWDCRRPKATKELEGSRSWN